MNILDDIIQKWTKNKDVEALMNEGLFDNIDAIQTSLDSLSGEEKQSALSLLDEIDVELSNYIDGIQQEKLTIKKQIDGTFKSEKACLSYGSSANIQNKRQPTKEE